MPKRTRRKNWSSWKTMPAIFLCPGDSGFLEQLGRVRVSRRSDSRRDRFDFIGRPDYCRNDANEDIHKS
jgi:hypothetical protein